MPFKSDKVVTDFFPLVLNGAFSFFLQLMFIPFIYNTVNRVVGEKSTRARESMRMMGMSDVSYWMSWLVYWTAINTTICVLIWAIGIINIFSQDNGGVLFFFVWLYGQSLFGLLLIA